MCVVVHNHDSGVVGAQVGSSESDDDAGDDSDGSASNSDAGSDAGSDGSLEPYDMPDKQEHPWADHLQVWFGGCVCVISSHMRQKPW